jgi:D-alanine-D-alanine ligase
MDKLKIAVFYGGISSEREVSIKTGKNILKALIDLGHDAYLVDIKGEFEWVLDEISYTPMLFKTLGFDLVFNALHGHYGEDGQLQTLLDIIDIKYTGSKALTSVIGINKLKTAEFLSKVGIDSPTSLVISRLEELSRLAESGIDFPVFCKPNDGGSSIATGRADNLQELKTLVLEGFKVSKHIIIQELIEGVEVSAPVLGNGKNARALAVGMIKTDNKFFDFEAKYNSDKTQEIFPAPLDPIIYQEIQTQALLAHQYLEASGISRSDFIITKDNRIVFLEINTSPGMTDQSLCPKAARAEGLSFEELVAKIVLDA